MAREKSGIRGTLTGEQHGSASDTRARKSSATEVGEQKYCPVPWAAPPRRLVERKPTESPRMRTGAHRTTGNLAYPGDKSLASGTRIYEKGVRNQTRSSS